MEPMVEVFYQYAMKSRFPFGEKAGSQADRPEMGVGWLDVKPNVGKICVFR